jgi:glycosyltransferase involved in cell wall biosynthesis
MPELYKLADCLIQASLFEGFSRVLLEAMSARIPIIAHDMDNNRWPINNEECLVDMNDIDRVVEKIIKISQDYNLQKLIVEKNYVNVIQRFDWRVLKNHYIEAIRRAFDDLNF